MIPQQQSRLACCLILFLSLCLRIISQVLELFNLHLVMTSVLYQGSTNNITFNDTIYRTCAILCKNEWRFSYAIWHAIGLPHSNYWGLSLHIHRSLIMIRNKPIPYHFIPSKLLLKKEKLVQNKICLALRYLVVTLETHHT